MDSNDLVCIPALKVGFCVWRRTSPVSDAIAKLLFVRFLPWTSSDHVTEHARLLFLTDWRESIYPQCTEYIYDQRSLPLNYCDL